MTVAELTTEAIDSMPAGREMDALVHQKVFDLPVEQHDGEAYCPNSDEQLFGVIPIPSYSTTIAAAWGVIEQLGPGAYIEKTPNGQAWEAGKTTPNAPVGLQTLFRTYAETAPWAICRAALGDLCP